MNGYRARTAPSWRVSDARPFRPQLVLAAVAVVGVLLMEVWQCSTVASLSAQVGTATSDLQKANAGLLNASSRLDRASNRASLEPMASAIGLRPADPQRMVLLPEEFLEPAEARASAPEPSLLALAGRAAHALVPDASARGRRVN
jgi:hypothetical protein